MNYSPKLKKVMAEIKAILKKNDVAAIVVLHTPGFSEYLMEIEPSYSCAKLERGMVKIKTSGLAISKKEKQQLLADTSNMLHHLSKTTMETGLNLGHISQIVDQKTGLGHTDSKHTPQDSLK